MGKDTAIGWCRHTFNAWLGCTHKSPACEFCYAEAWANRFGKVGWGARAPRKRTAPDNWRQPLKWDKAAREAGEIHTVFCNSLSDVFDDHESILPEWRADLWDLIRRTPNLHWLPLTKRPENWNVFLPSAPLDNVTLGVTIEDQRRLDESLSYMDVAIRMGWGASFVSYEPALGRVDWEPALKHRLISCIISGGGSGGDHRPSDPDWHRNTRDACAKWGVAYNFKQWGNWAPANDGTPRKPGFGEKVKWVGGKGKSMRELDGVEHNGMPGAGT